MKPKDKAKELKNTFGILAELVVDEIMKANEEIDSMENEHWEASLGKEWNYWAKVKKELL